MVDSFRESIRKEDPRLTFSKTVQGSGAFLSEDTKDKNESDLFDVLIEGGV